MSNLDQQRSTGVFPWSLGHQTFRRYDSFKRSRMVSLTVSSILTKTALVRKLRNVSTNFKHLRSPEFPERVPGANVGLASAFVVYREGHKFGRSDTQNDYRNPSQNPRLLDELLLDQLVQNHYLTHSTGRYEKPLLVIPCCASYII